MRAMRIAAWQMEPKVGAIDANLARLDAVLKREHKQGSDLLVAPEMFLTGFGPEATRHAAVRADPVFEAISSLVRKHGVGLAASILTKRGSGRYNTFHAWGPDGRLLGTQDKIHLWADEARRTRPGTRPNVIRSPWAVLGGMVCYDVEFPEVSRSLAVAGAEVLLAPSAFYSPSGWDVATRGRALENGCYLVAPNQVGGNPRHPHNGTTRIIDPYGIVVAELGPSAEGVVRFDLDPKRLRAARQYAPFLRDRRLGVAKPAHKRSKRT